MDPPTRAGGPAVAWTAGTVARRLGIPRATLRSWNQRYGLGPADHEPGRYRRYTETDLAELEMTRRLVAQGVPTATAAELARSRRGGHEATGKPGSRRRVPTSWRGLETACLRMDADTVRDALDDSLAARGVLATWNRMCRPVLARLGDRVTSGADCLGAEFLLSWTAIASLHGHARAGSPEPARVLLACAEGERHSLGLETLAAALAEHQIGTRMLGADVPRAALVDAVTRTRPRAVVLSAQRPFTARAGVLRSIAPATDLLVAAGPGWPDRPPRGVTHGSTMESALDAVRAAVEPAARGAGA